jgi:hypothetical protein
MDATEIVFAEMCTNRLLIPLNTDNLQQRQEDYQGARLPRGQCAIAEDKQHWSVIGWVTKNLIKY